MLVGLKYANDVFGSTTCRLHFCLWLRFRVITFHTSQFLNVVFKVQHNGVCGFAIWAGCTGNKPFSLTFTHNTHHNYSLMKYALTTKKIAALGSAIIPRLIAISQAINVL